MKSKKETTPDEYRIITYVVDLLFAVVAKLYIPSTLNIDLILWHTHLIVCA